MLVSLDSSLSPLVRVDGGRCPFCVKVALDLCNVELSPATGISAWCCG